MKTILFLAGFLISAFAIGQDLDFDRFDESIMNKVLFQKMNEYTETNFNYSISPTTKGQKFIYKLLIKNIDKMLFDELDIKLNKKIGKRYDSNEIKKVNQVGCIGLLDSIPSNCIKTYQEAAKRCIKDWSNSDNSLFMGWRKNGSAISIYNSRNQTLYLFFGYFE